MTDQLKPPPTIIPAFPDFTLILEYTSGEERFAMLAAPIIAWKIDGVEVWPITDEGVVREGGQTWAIQRPNGEVVIVGDCTYGSFEKYLAGIGAKAA